MRPREVSSDQRVYGSIPLSPSKRVLITQLLAIGVDALLTFPLDAFTYRKLYGLKRPEEKECEFIA